MKEWNTQKNVPFHRDEETYREELGQRAHLEDVLLNVSDTLKIEANHEHDEPSDVSRVQARVDVGSVKESHRKASAPHPHHLKMTSIIRMRDTCHVNRRLFWFII